MDIFEHFKKKKPATPPASREASAPKTPLLRRLSPEGLSLPRCSAWCTLAEGRLALFFTPDANPQLTAVDVVTGEYMPDVAAAFAGGRIFEDNTTTNYRLAASRDGSRAVLAADNLLYFLTPGGAPRLCDLTPYRADMAVFSPDGTRVALYLWQFGGGRKLALYDAISAEAIWERPCRSLNVLTFSPDGTLLFAGGEGGFALVCDGDGNKLLQGAVAAPGNPDDSRYVMSASFDAGGRAIYVCTYCYGDVERWQNLQRIDLESGVCAPVPQATGVKAALVMPDGGHLLTVSMESYALSLRDIASGEELAAVPPPVTPGGKQYYIHDVVYTGGPLILTRDSLQALSLWYAVDCGALPESFEDGWEPPAFLRGTAARRSDEKEAFPAEMGPAASETIPGLSSVTRGGVSPRRKPKVFFAAHGKDLTDCLREISRDVLAAVDCAVWYHPPLTELSSEDMELALSDMRLVVLAVTRNLLDDGGGAVGEQLRCAREMHIPILPLLQEPGLEAEFNAIYGNLQLLCKRWNDPTATDFSVKLADYLHNVLGDDAINTRVRDAFDAYIFLSYRKKDRKYARELMELIHKNPFARDVAVWFDEFLTPGEEFDEEILAALNKSSLFALTVTPSVVEEGNYVMTTEYPAAKTSGAAILGAEMVPTDPAALETHYPGLPPCIDPREGESFGAALLRALEDSGVRRRKDTPEHLFFMGLAYLRGIDVEVDAPRGIELLTAAAEAGLEEARAQLVAVYERGDGVAVDLDKAAEWQKRLVEKSDERRRESGAAEDFFLWCERCLTFCELCAKAGRGEEGDLALRDALTELGSRRSDATIEERRLHLRLSRKLCEQALPLEKPELLRGYAHKTEELAEGLFRDTGDESFTHDRAWVCTMRAAAARQEGERQTMESEYRRALGLYNTLFDRSAIDLRRGLAALYSELGCCAFLNDDLTEAIGFLNSAYALAKGVAEEERAAGAWYALADICEESSHIYSLLGNREKEREYRDLALDNRRLANAR